MYDCDGQLKVIDFSCGDPIEWKDNLYVSAKKWAAENGTVFQFIISDMTESTKIKFTNKFNNSANDLLSV